MQEVERRHPRRGNSTEQKTEHGIGRAWVQESTTEVVGQPETVLNGEAFVAREDALACILANATCQRHPAAFFFLCRLAFPSLTAAPCA